MPGKRYKVTPEIEAYIHDRRRCGLSHRAIVDELAAKGTPLSLGAVHKIAPASPTGVTTRDGHVRLNVPARAPSATETPPPTSEAPTPPPPDADVLVPDDADLATLEKLEKEWQDASATAKANGNLSGFIALQRLLRDVVIQKRKVRAPPAEKPEDHPDFVRAGERAAESLHRLIDEALRAAGAIEGRRHDST